MPIIIPSDLPANNILNKEKIFTMQTARAVQQDIRPIEVAIVNLMPTKVETETQLLRLLGNTPLQVNVTFIKTATHKSKNTSKDHLDRFYIELDKIRKRQFDGMIVTGAPVETIPFEDVDYWEELEDIIDWAQTHVTSTIYICWGAQAALYHLFNIQKRELPEKLFGVYGTKAAATKDMLLKGMDDTFFIPHSRYTEIDNEQVWKSRKVKVLAYSDVAGISILKTHDNRSFFFTGHAEYDSDTLKKEYLRDLKKGIKIKKPENYFVNEISDEIDMKWKSTANLLFYNWLNYYVYQVTPFEFKEIEEDFMCKKKKDDKSKGIKKPEEKSTEAQTVNRYHVSQNKDDEHDRYKEWRVRKEGSEKTIQFFPTQEEAIEFAKTLAKNNSGHVVIHKVNGEIRKLNY